ncbi:hypothetical protein F5B21DRAFT_526859 [Xylaria acuta]|nr:hypothetical protein F5B21DRAFT_526859 [Xylaria acuta]
MTIPKFPCDKCDCYQGENAFKRKDNLERHLKGKHNPDNDQLVPMFAPRRTRKPQIPVCPFKDCEYYRGPEFKDLAVEKQQDNRPFAQRADYIDHLKKEHNWSPFPCKVPGCDKINGNGYFGFQVRKNHYEGEHPGSTIPGQKPEDPTPKTTKCNHCQSSFDPGHIAKHQKQSCQGKANRRIKQLKEYEEAYCTAPEKCARCSNWTERRLLGLMDFCTACFQYGDSRT